MLAEQDGLKQWNDGLAPFITPQFRTEVFGYEHVPPEIEVPAAAEAWAAGAGFDLGAIGGGAAISSYYNYSRGVDLSYEDRVFLSPEMQACTESDETAIGATPAKFYSCNFGLYVLADIYLYRFDIDSQTWVNVHTDSYTLSDIVEYNNIMYLARTDATTNTLYYYYSVNGITWKAQNLGEIFAAALAGYSPGLADYFTIRGNSSGLTALWKSYNNTLSNASNPYPDTMDWSGTDEVGHTSETTTGIVTVNNDIYVFKTNGIFVYDGVQAQDIWKTQYINDYNGRNPFVWIDSLIYVVYEDRLLQFNPYNYDITPVYPLPEQDSLEVKGHITAVTGDGHHMYLAVKNKDGNTYIMKGRPGSGWHTMTYLGANDCDAMIAVPDGVVHATNPALVFGYGTAANYYILPRNYSHPDDDENYRYETSGFVVGPYINFGAKSFSKFLNRASILGDRISAGRPVTLKYEIDRSGTEVTLVTATADGISEADETSEIQFNQLRYILYLDTGDNYVSPAVDSLALYATLNPRRKRIWRPVIILSDSLAVTTGAYNTQQPSSFVMRDILYGAVTKRLTLTDDRANTYVVRLLDISSAGKVAKTIGGKHHDSFGYQLTIVEIRTLNTNQTIGVYDEHAYDSGVVFAG